jgi:hypothetical protein
MIGRTILATSLAAVVSLGATGAASTATVVDCATNPGALQAALAAAAPGGTLRVKGTCLGTYIINKDVTLVGRADATLDGNGSGPVVTIVAGVQVVLDHLVVRGGRSIASVAVGGIANSGHLQLRRSQVLGNTARGEVFATAGISSRPASTASLSLVATEVADNHAVTITAGSGFAVGGILTEGLVTLSRSDVRGNSALASTASFNRTFGGIALAAGAAHLTRTTISENVARSEHTGTTGSGLAAAAIGGIGRPSGDDELVMDNVLVQGNRAFAVSAVGSGATGGIQSGTATIARSDVVGNLAEAGSFAAGGLANHDGAVELERSHLTGNTATANSPAGLAAGGMATGYLGAASTIITRGSVTGNSALAADATGGLYQAAGSSYELIRPRIEGNTPIDCNFAGCRP